MRRPGERTRLRRGLRPGSYKVTARRGCRHCVGHLEVGSTDHFEGISASPIRGQARAEMARIHHRSPLMETLTLTQREQARLRVLNSLLAGHMTMDQAATLMGVSIRHTRRILAGAGLKSPRRRRPPKHRVRRQRMPREGMLIQVDGSHHRWLGHHVPPFALLLAVDDATGIVVNALFCEQENTRDYFLLMRGLIQCHGIPIALYTDRHSVFKNVPGSGLARAPTQFSRAMDELGVQMVFALSPQAKGRVERTAGTLQSRLVAELRLAGATTIEEANAVLKEFLVRFNERFGVPVQHPEAAYRMLEPDVCLENVLCFRHRRRVARDNTVMYRWRTLQLLPGMERPTYCRSSGGGPGSLGTAGWQCGTGERASPTRRRRPVPAYSEASTALPQTGQPLDPAPTVWAGAGRLPWQHSTPGPAPPMLTTWSKKAMQPQSAEPLPRRIGNPLHFSRQGGRLCRRPSAGACRFEVSPGKWASIGTLRRSTWRLRVRHCTRIGSGRSHLLTSWAAPVTFMLAT